MHVSPSQIATWRACQRKWWYSRNRPRTESKFTAFGTRTHAILEGWLKYQQWPTPPPGEPMPAEAQCAASGLQHLPMPGTCLVEAPIRWTVDSVQYVGFVDCLALDEANATVVVIDHKTTGDFKWAKTTDALLDDPQRIIYATWAAALLHAAPVTHATARWVYYRRNKPYASQVVEVTEAIEPLAQRFVDLHKRYALPIVQAHGSKSPDDFPRNLSHCSAYGGCPYAEECLATVSVYERAANAAAGGNTNP